ncbi:hypothetical protein ILYODFUR_036582 [Ilyodon furcidens]|uniref:Uncharacterized protein n=1 Tax=Ilyodon furcidens TaxID=33524 RepID=A0ABV0UR42_9TELE
MNPITHHCQTGHLTAQCIKISVHKNHLCSALQTLVSQEDNMSSAEVLIKEKPCVALLVPGSNCTLVRQDSLPEDVIFHGATAAVCCIHGEEMHYPVAEVIIKVKGQCFTVFGGVLQMLLYQVVLQYNSFHMGYHPKIY